LDVCKLRPEKKPKKLKKLVRHCTISYMFRGKSPSRLVAHHFRPDSIRNCQYPADRIDPQAMAASPFVVAASS
jgi:hypothetical protein